MVEVPDALSRAHDVPICYAGRPLEPASCAGSFVGSRRLVEAPTIAGRYNPFYYALVGWPSLFSSASRAVYLMRLASAAVCAAFLASAFASAAANGHRRAVVLGTGLAITPMAVFLAGSVNPNALEIAASVCLWVSGLVLLQGGGASPSRLAARTGVAAIALVMSRPLAPLWLALIALVLAGTVGWEAVRRLWQHREVRLWGAAVTVGAVLAVGWTATAGSLDVMTATAADALPMSQVARTSIGKTGHYLLQMVGVFGWLDTPAPALTYHLWYFALGFALLAGLAVATKRGAAVLTALVALVLAVPPVIEMAQARNFGFAWQGRYTLPRLLASPSWRPLLSVVGYQPFPRDGAV